MVWALPFPHPLCLLCSGCKDLVGPQKCPVAFTQRPVSELLPQPGTLLCCAYSFPLILWIWFRCHFLWAAPPRCGSIATSDNGLSYHITLTCSIPKWLHATGRQWSCLFIRYCIFPIAQHAVGASMSLAGWVNKWIIACWRLQSGITFVGYELEFCLPQKVRTLRTEWTAKYCFSSGFISWNVTAAGGDGDKFPIPQWLWGDTCSWTAHPVYVSITLSWEVNGELLKMES